MKKFLCILFPFLFLAVPAFAESDMSGGETLAALVDSAIDEFGSYKNVTFHEDLGIMVVDIAFDGMVDQVIHRKANGLDETEETWMGAKNATIEYSKSIDEFIKSTGFNDVALILNIVNDDAYCHKDFSTLEYNPLFTVVGGKVTNDVMKGGKPSTTSSIQGNADNQKEVTVPPGKYTVGTDIPAGSYSVYVVSGFTTIEVFDGINDTWGDSNWLDDGEYIGKLSLTNGQIVDIGSGSLIFKPYQGLGF